MPGCLFSVTTGKRLPIPAGKTQERFMLFWRNMKNIRELSDHLGGGAALLRLELA
jgi:hypothetical protein